MNRTTPASQSLFRALPRTGFNDLHADAQSQVIEHAAADPSKATTVEDAWTIARLNARLCTVSKQFQEHIQPYVHLSGFYTLALIDCEEPSSKRRFSVKKNLINTTPRTLFQRLEKMPDRKWPLTPVQRLQVWVDAHMGLATPEDFETCLGPLMGLVKAATAAPKAQLPYRTIPTLMAMFLCRSLTNPQEGNTWHLSAVHRLMDALREVHDENIAVPALLQFVVIAMVYEHMGRPFIRFHVGNSQVTLTTQMVLDALRKHLDYHNDSDVGLRAVAAVLAATPQAPADANTINIALNCLETLDHPLIGVWAATLNKLEGLELPHESRQRLDRCVQKAEQNGCARGSAPPGELLIKRVWANSPS
ncbi:hypothetical protein [uncultured Hydrogenophaga sp.]|uniref:hypothetical protein n=1 Tax=uncultured Hydrogenophaga sp. TaxID=199683 RepID=UPI002585DA9D|nr:hypothetical protein [uncultured Hydrogenophaga sp.]